MQIFAPVVNLKILILFYLLSKIVLTRRNSVQCDGGKAIGLRTRIIYKVNIHVYVYKFNFWPVTHV